MIDWAAASSRACAASIGLRGGHRDRHQHVDPAAPARGQPRRGGHHLGDVAVLVEGDQHRVVLGLGVDRRARDRHLGRGGQVEAVAVAVDRVDDDPDASQPIPAMRHAGVERGHDAQRRERAEARRRSRTGAGRARMRMLPGRRYGRSVRAARSAAGHRQVRDRERQHRAERVQVAQERRPGRGSGSARRSQLNRMIPTHGVR